nr:hypothetical protein CFP56_34411 [Quercus suber]
MKGEGKNLKSAAEDNMLSIMQVVSLCGSNLIEMVNLVLLNIDYLPPRKMHPFDDLLYLEDIVESKIQFLSEHSRYYS